MFIGREEELHTLARCAAEARQGRPWVVWVQGEPGIGKSALVRHWLDRDDLAGFRVLDASGGASRADVPFGVVRRLVAGTPPRRRAGLDLLDRLPDSAPPFQVGAELLELLGRYESEGPVAVVVDEAQWADRPSLQALGFVLRRLRADAVLTVLVTRSGVPAGQGDVAWQDEVERLAAVAERVCRVVLKGLNTAEVARLALHVAGFSLGTGTADRIRAMTGGNALYLGTLLAELPQDELERGVLRPPPSLAAAVHRRVAGLPESGRALVEAAAVLELPAPLGRVARTAGVADPAAALDAGLAAGLLQWWPAEPYTPVAVRHELQRLAVVAAIPPGRLRALHAAAAPLVDRDRSWHHRVGAAEGADDGLAVALAGEADRLTSVGSTEAAANLLLLASRVAGTRPGRERFLLMAMALLMGADRFTRVQHALPEVRRCAASPMRSLVLGAYATSRGELAEAEQLLTDAMEATEATEATEGMEGTEGTDATGGTGGTGGAPGDPVVTALAGVWLGRLYTLRADGRALASVSARVLAGEPEKAGLTALAHLARANLATGRAFTDGPAAGLAELAALPAVPSQVGPDAAILLTYRGIFHTWSGRLTSAVEDCAAVLDLGRRTGCPVLAEFVYPTLTAAQFWLGSWDDAAISAENGLLVTATEDKPWAYAAGYVMASRVASGRGQWARAEELLEAAGPWAQAVGAEFSLPLVALGRAQLAHAKDDHEGVLAALRPVEESAHRRDRAAVNGMVVLTQLWWRPLYAQALIELGRLDAARAAVADLRAFAEGVPCLRPAASWLDGLLQERQGAREAALATYRQGLSLPVTADDIPLHRALLEQALSGALAADPPGSAGRQEATAWLRQARDRFARLGAQPFLKRCEDALAALQDGTALSGPSLLERLSDRERDVAHLVARGMTNKEIATELFISARTVDYHLGNIYARLGITGRRRLRDLVQRGTAPA